jgi:hypothetical protein
MLSPREMSIIRAEVGRLQNALNACTDGGIQNLIRAWIEEGKKKLKAGEQGPPK